ncbi:hypothetical protein AiwAL_17825 [Acidiphilium sp. AL]|uniref:cation-transporting P-type ATPase n=2 Tax=Acidiphilium TaxID=522 RepID=UPI0038B30B5F|nr:hypothetical protein [Acidiphilium sp. AL]
MSGATEDMDPGLTRTEAARRLVQFGPNAVADVSERWIAAIAGKVWPRWSGICPSPRSARCPFLC